MRRKLLLIVAPAAGAAAVIAIATAALASSSPGANPTQTPAVSGTAPATSQSRAEQAALTYLTAKYPGTGTALVLSTHLSEEHGQAAYEVKAIAPDGKTYEVYVSKASGTVLKASRDDSGEEDGSSSHRDDSPDGYRAGHDDSPDHGGGSTGLS